MIVQTDFLRKIKDDFKLNIYEVKIWASLLSKGIAAAGELSNISGVPRSRCYDVLESLEKKGFIIMKLGKPINYIAVKPEEIIERVKKNIRQETTINLNILNAIKTTDVFRELELLHKTGIEKIDSGALTNIIIGKNNLYSFIKKLVENAKSSVVVVTTKERIEKKLRLLRNSLNRLNKKGINIKVVAPAKEEIIKGLRTIQSDITARFIVVDNKEALFMLSDKVNPDYETGIWIKSELFSNILVDLLNNYLNNHKK